MVVFLIISILFNIFLIQEARAYATKTHDKYTSALANLRIMCEYIDLFIIKDCNVEKKYTPLNWGKLTNMKKVTSGALECNSLVDLCFRNLKEEDYYNLTTEHKKRIYNASANTKVFTDEEIRKLAEVTIDYIKEIQRENSVKT